MVGELTDAPVEVLPAGIMDVVDGPYTVQTDEGLNEAISSFTFL